ncbi:hypothetical protein [Pedobacter metabolipauper]|uniref:Uncharacterized protein n=1 Tax=Pedobacter metabolipauper TaxID=425513 RepID=A0A4R6T033_9SPHI|nr:hypothetical protein [Pedobacter metabolipauper]TDQ11369.1 hypothetical protein ATK78_0487 [Pedobacter metabolipauper]
MKNWELSSGYIFSIEQAGRRIILCVYKDDNLLVCRREYLLQVKRSIEDPDVSRLFAGRLKLFKFGPDLHIESQGQYIGTISVDEFEEEVDVLIFASKETQPEI